MIVFPALPVLSLSLAMLLWGSAFVAFKYAILYFDPIVIVFARMILACLLFFLVYPLWRPRRIKLVDTWFMILMALCEPCLYFVFEGQALRLTTASQAGMVAATLPVLVALCAGVLLGERLTRRSWTGLFLALAGVVWVSVSGDSSEVAPRPVLGNLLELMAMLCAAGYTVSMKRLSATYSPWFLTAVQSMVGTVFFFPLLFLPSTTLPSGFPAGASLAVIYLAVGVSIGAYGFFNFGISRLPAWQATAFVNLIPVVSIVLGWMLLDESLNAVQLVGVAVVFGGVILSQDWTEEQKDTSDESVEGVFVEAGRTGQAVVPVPRGE